MNQRICMVTSIHPDFDVRIMKQAKSLASYGYKIDLICPWDSRVHIPGISFLTFKKASNRKTRFLNYIKITKYLIKRKYMLYHFHDIDILPLFCIVKFISKKPIIYDIHENYPDEMLVRYWIPRYFRHIFYFLVKYIQRICAYYIRNLIIVAPSQEEEFKSPHFNKTMVRNFASKNILATKKDNYESRHDSVIFIGKQNITNGSLVFLEITNRIVKRYPHVKFFCIDWFDGDNSLKNQMISYIDKLEIQKNIIFLPPVKAHEIMSYLNEATIGVSPNLRVARQIKAIPTKFFEYMAASLPIVASNLPYQRKVLSENKCGLIADPDSVDNFVDKICFLISNRSTAKKMGENGFKAFISLYCWEKEVKKLKAIYESLLSSNKNNHTIQSKKRIDNLN